MPKYLSIIVGASALCLLIGASPSAPLNPPAILDSDLTVRVDKVGTMPFVAGKKPNLMSPVAIDGALYFIDQHDAIYRDDGNGFTQVFQVNNAPAGLALDNSKSIINVAPGRAAGNVYVAFTSRTLPSETVPVYRLPDPLPGICCNVNNPTQVPDLYRMASHSGTRTEFQVLYEYEVSGNTLASPRAIAAFEAQSSFGHDGGGMVTLPDGRVLFATGDSLPFGLDGRAAPQDEASHLGKLLIVDPDDGSIEVAAKGVRNVQRIEYVDDGSSTGEVLGFADIGGATSEEINYVRVEDLVTGSEALNLGWGRNEDGFAREGTFYIGPGIGLVFGPYPPTVDVAPEPEPGFEQPHAQYGRTDPSQYVAVTGPVTSTPSFDTITGLFGDLASGQVLATTDLTSETNVDVFDVNLVDSDANATTLASLAGGRPDPRFFRFPDGTAGVLLEATGDFYRLTQTD